MSSNQQTCESVAELDQSLRRNGDLRPGQQISFSKTEQGYIWQNLRPGHQIIQFFSKTEQGQKG